MGEELLKYMRNNEDFDIIFLDIEMQEINGIQVGAVIRKELDRFLTQIIYVTAFESYIGQLFQNQSFEYIAKPIDEKRSLTC